MLYGSSLFLFIVCKLLIDLNWIKFDSLQYEKIGIFFDLNILTIQVIYIYIYLTNIYLNTYS